MTEPPIVEPPGPAPTEYFYYRHTVGDMRLFVMAEFERPEPREKYLDGFRAYSGFQGGVPRLLKPEYLPTAIRLETKRSVPPIFMTKGEFIIIDTAVRAVIEGLEPGRHQFIPISVSHKNGEEEPREFFILNVYHIVEAMALDEMGVIRTELPDGQTSLRLPQFFEDAAKLKRAALKGAGHLFTDPRCDNPSSAWFISKEMVEAIRKGKGDPRDLYPCEVID